MADLQGTIVAAGIVPTSTEDTYPTHDSKYGAGGWREVATLSDRNDIPRERMREGMAVRVADNNTVYILNTLGQTRQQDVWQPLPTGGSGTGNMILTQAEYDALPTKTMDTWYMVVDDNNILRKIYVGIFLIGVKSDDGNVGLPYTFPFSF